MPHVSKVVVQTNLSFGLDWLQAADTSTAALWCTYHPSQVSRKAFLKKSKRLDELGIAHSVGMVGVPSDIDEIEAMRRDLPSTTYLWINALDNDATLYTDDEIARLIAVDPQFEINASSHASQGQSCWAGEQSISIDGSGTIRRCHFVADPIGNLYEDDLSELLRPRDCPNAECNCHIGYVNLKGLTMDRVYADRILERIPVSQD